MTSEATARGPVSRLMAGRDGLAVLGSSALIAIVACALQTLLGGLPEPLVHDEQSFLLMADTFRQGRLANPSPVGWHHFETFHVLMQPTYASKYFPGQGLLLALGWVIGGHPIVGTWLAAGLLAASLAWMLRVRHSALWAVGGATLAVLFTTATSYWGTSYWGGALPAAGAALVVGAILRAEDGTIRDGSILGVGFSVLLATRPWEGFLLGLPALGFLLATGHGRSRWTARRLRLLVPAGAALLATICFLLYYSDAVTGDPRTTPYQEYQRSYDPVPTLMFGSPQKDLSYRHERFAKFYVQWARLYERAQTQVLSPKHLAGRVPVLLMPTGVFLLPFVLVGGAFAAPRERTWIATSVVILLGFLAFYPLIRAHYLATIVPLLYLMIVDGMHRVWRAGTTRAGRLSVILVVTLSLSVAHASATRSAADSATNPLIQTRAPMERALARTAPGRHLVLVTYSDGAELHQEWVWNWANFESTPVLWARSMGKDEDRRLLEAYPERRAWRLRVGPPGRPVALSASRDAETSKRTK